MKSQQNPSMRKVLDAIEADAGCGLYPCVATGEGHQGYHGSDHNSSQLDETYGSQSHIGESLTSLEGARTEGPPSIINMKGQMSTQSQTQKTEDIEAELQETPFESEYDRQSLFMSLLGDLNPCQPWFIVTEGPGREIDVPLSFSSYSCIALIWKFACAICAIFSVAYGFFEYDPNFYLAYFDRWGLVFASFYFLFSVVNSTFPGCIQQPETYSVGCGIRLTWLLFESAAHWGALSTALYWWLEFKPQLTHVTFLNLASHGIVVTLVWVDGMFVNRIPVRWMHWTGCILPMEMAWFVWSGLQAYLEVSNRDNTTEQDDLIYDYVDWEDDWVFSAGVAAFTLFGMGPCIYLAMWLFSKYALPCFCMMEKRFYAVEEDQDEEAQDAAADDVDKKANEYATEEESIIEESLDSANREGIA